MPHEDDPVGENLGEIFYTELGQDDVEEEDDALSCLSNDLGRLNLKEQAASGRIGLRARFHQ